MYSLRLERRNADVSLSQIDHAGESERGLLIVMMVVDALPRLLNRPLDLFDISVDALPFQVDHIIAEKHHGPTAEGNLALSC